MEVAREKCEALIQKVAHQQGVNKIETVELEWLTTAAEVAQYAQKQVQRIKDLKNQKLTQTETNSLPQPKKEALSSGQKIALGGGIAGALIAAGVAVKVISAKKLTKNR